MPSSLLSASIAGRKHSPWSRKSPKNSAKDSAGTLRDAVLSFAPETNISLPASNKVFIPVTLTSIFRLLTVGEWQFVSVCIVCYRRPLTLFLEPHADRIDHPSQAQDSSYAPL